MEKPKSAVAVVEAGPPDVLSFGSDSRVLSNTDRFVSDFSALMTIAKPIFEGNFAPTGCKHPSDVAMILLTGTELGLSHAQSLRMMYMIKGKPVLAADAMAAVVKRFCVQKGGGFIRVVENTNDSATVEYQRHDDPDVRSVTWTVDDAKRAGLLTNPVWQNYPGDLCKARALTRAARTGWPDVLGGVYDPDELKYVSDEEPRQTRPASSIETDEPSTRRNPHVKRLSDSTDSNIQAQLAAYNAERSAAIEEPTQSAVPDRADGDPITADDLTLIRELAASRGISGIDFQHLVWFRYDGVTPEELTVEQGRGFYRLLLEKNTPDETLQQLMSKVNTAVNNYYNQKSAQEENQRGAQVASAK